MIRLFVTITLSLVLSASVTADQLVSDDLIVDGNGCFGFDCAEGESFDRNVLLLKDNNNRIRFEDTSASAAFPRRDWVIEVNDAENGGQEHFSIVYIDLNSENFGYTPFRIVAGAPPSSLFVGPDGAIGLGTDSPQKDLHIISGNTPTIRLEQDGSQAFDPASWDIAGDEDGFSIAVNNGTVLTLDASGNLTIPGTLTAGVAAAEFPDYVFSADYELLPLADLEEYINTNNHLPGIPSALDVGESGVNMTQLQFGLLRKLEELTLYTLQQQEIITDLQRQVKALRQSEHPDS